MITLLIAAFAALLLCVALYVIFRRQHHGGLAGGSGTISPPRTQAGLGPGRIYTEEQVASHCTSEDLWLIIKGKVYNLTDYVALHPGGEALLRNGGRDSTEGFSGSQHPARVWDMIDEFYIGDLVKLPNSSTKED